MNKRLSDPFQAHFFSLLPHAVKAPVKKGDVVGTLHVTYEGKEVAKTDLVAMQDAERKSFFLTVWKNVKSLFF